MNRTRIPLESLAVASPCSADWGLMTGDDRVRHCSHCDKHVYNLSELSSYEAEELILEMEGSLCVRYYVRHDGTMLTTDCPVGWRNAQSKFAWLAGGMLAGILGIFGVSLASFAMFNSFWQSHPGQPRPGGLGGLIHEVLPPQNHVVMGAMLPPVPVAEVAEPPVPPQALVERPAQNADPK